MTFDNFTYLVYMAVFSWLPISILWVRYFKYLKGNFSTIFKAVAISFPVAMIWDIIAVYNKAWQYSPDRILNINIFFMPIEEFLLIGSSVFGIACITVLFYEYLTKRRIIKYNYDK